MRWRTFVREVEKGLRRDLDLNPETAKVLVIDFVAGRAKKLIIGGFGPIGRVEAMILNPKPAPSAKKKRKKA